MPYFKNNDVNILLIHIPKTGGTSLERYLKTKFNISLDNNSLFDFPNDKIKTETKIKTSLQHMTYQTIIKYKNIFKIDFNNLKIIAAVRNPYERIISDLFFLYRINLDSSKENVFNAIKIYIYNIIDNHTIPQYIFITDKDKKLIPNIHILKTESLNNDMYNLGYTDFNNDDNNFYRNKINYYDYLNSDSIKLINYIYDYDFTLFNYKKLIPNSDLINTDSIKLINHIYNYDFTLFNYKNIL